MTVLEFDKPRAISERTFDDYAAVGGAAVASLATTWVLYGKVLPTEGVLGFALFWYVGFVAFYAAVSAFTQPRVTVVDRVVSAVVHGGTALVALALITTVGFVFVEGWPALRHLNFFTEDMGGVRPTAPLTEGGVRHAVVGTAIQVALAVAMALPLGVATAVYMAEVGGRLSNAVRTVIEAMTALPDVLAGLFVYTVFIIAFRWERSGLAASIALAVTMLPVIARSAEVVLKVVPAGLREASWALGASKWQTVRGVVLPTSRSGLATSLIIGIARVTGETAPLLIVSGASTFFNTNPTKNPMNSLPLFIFTAVRSGEEEFITRGYGAAALLVTLVLGLFALTRVLARGRLESK